MDNFTFQFLFVLHFCQIPNGAVLLLFVVQSMWCCCYFPADLPLRMIIEQKRLFHYTGNRLYWTNEIKQEKNTDLRRVAAAVDVSFLVGFWLHLFLSYSFHLHGTETEEKPIMYIICTCAGKKCTLFGHFGQNGFFNFHFWQNSLCFNVAIEKKISLYCFLSFCRNPDPRRTAINWPNTSTKLTDWSPFNAIDSTNCVSLIWINVIAENQLNIGVEFAVKRKSDVDCVRWKMTVIERSKTDVLRLS